MGRRRGENVGFKWLFPQTQGPVKDVPLRMAVRLIRRDLPQFFQSPNQGVVASQDLHPAIQIDCVSAAVTNMGDGHTVSQYKDGRQGCPSTRSIT